MATSSTTPPHDWLVGFQIYIGQVGMEFGYTGNVKG